VTPERFNQLLEGPLGHPMIPFRITRLALALWAVLEATGKTGANALEAHCAERERQDGAGND
jgi:hypothetical protein